MYVAVPTKHRKIIGETIRRYRKQVGFSQEKLAEKADLHPVYIGKVERGEKVVSVHALLRIAKALKIRLRDLVAEV
jgi:transcriptional regulator with XRE-family HTH domain